MRKFSPLTTRRKDIFAKNDNFLMEYKPEDAEEMLKKTGMKVDKAAAKEFAQLLEEITADIASEAEAIAMRNKKKAVTAAEVKEAMKELLSS